MLSIQNKYLIINTYFQKLPIDIIDYIISINKDWAFKIIKNPILNYKSNLLKNDIKIIYNLIIFANQSGLGCSLDNYCIHLKDKIYNKEKLFNKLIKCKCCERHQTSRPTELKLWIDTEFDFSNNIHKCMCSCRHISRWICRGIN